MYQTSRKHLVDYCEKNPAAPISRNEARTHCTRFHKPTGHMHLFLVPSHTSRSVCGDPSNVNRTAEDRVLSDSEDC